MISGADAMVLCLQNEGVSTIFGYPGAAIAPFYDSLSRQDKIRHILTRGEQAAGHAANGFARITGRPGVCVATSGPGATNLFTAIATAYSDSIPMVAITGQVATWQLGHDVFQEVDTTGAVEPFTKYSFLVKDANEIGRVFREAFYIASTGRKGPVLIDIPIDVQQQEIRFSYPESVSIRGYKPNYTPHPLQLKKLEAALSKAERPLICYGGGVFLSGGAQSGQELFAAAIAGELADKTGIPAVSTMMGVSVLQRSHPLYFGMVGQSGDSAANTAVSESDLLILIGARVSDRTIRSLPGMDSGRIIVHVDIDTAEIGKNMGTSIPIVGDAFNVMTSLRDSGIDARRPEWTGRLAAIREKAAASETESPGYIDPAAFVRRLCSYLPEGSVYVADVGQNQIWSARSFCSPGRFITTGGMGTMGYSIPAAIGVKLANPESTVVAVCGDGGFQMSMSELATLRQSNIPLKIVIMKNGRLGMVRELQRHSFGREAAVELAGDPDFLTLASAYGIDGVRISDLSGAGRAIEAMLSSDGPFIIECVVDPERETI